MASDSLEAFYHAVDEVEDLQRADRTPVGGTSSDPTLTRVVGRASVVLLSSHFERYLYGVNEEATDALNGWVVAGTALPMRLRLLHSRSSIDGMVETAWERRGDHLERFIQNEAWLWGGEARGALDHERLLRWMKSPTPQNVVRFYKFWGIKDIFSAVTRAVHTRTEMRLRLDELVRKRNNIAHGDPSTEATASDVASYRAATLRFCERADSQLGRAVGRIAGNQTPW
ncbi:MAG TPA: HEPN domain-containing protein [Solirubrobacteraceae bacterium]|nr:HEPN domain-containing protein [Solirubrobacteraceae bacterium]